MMMLRVPRKSCGLQLHGRRNGGVRAASGIIELPTTAHAGFRGRLFPDRSGLVAVDLDDTARLVP
jgi:hypothetical protein